MGRPRSRRREGKVGDEPATIYGPDVKRTPALAVLLTTSDIVEADLKAGWLGANGVPCVITGAHMAGNVFGGLAGTIKAKILVPEDRIDECNHLLEILAVGDNLSLAEYEPSEE